MDRANLVSKPFPLETGIGVNPDKFISFTPLNGKEFYEFYDGRSEVWEAFSELDQDSVNDSRDYSELQNGYLYLSHVGCGMSFILVVTGKVKGSIWFDDLGSDNGLFPLTKSHDRLEFVDFLTFYENWLDACLRVVNGQKAFPQDDWYFCLGYTDYVHEATNHNRSKSSHTVLFDLGNTM